MNDEFLYQFRKPPRREFAEALYARISRDERRALKVPAARRVALVMMVLVVGLGLAVLSSPSARASLGEVITEVGGIIFKPTDEYPGSREAVKVRPELTMTLEEAQETVPFAFSLPAWAPDGFEINSNVSLLPPTEYSEHWQIFIRWQKGSSGQEGYETLNLEITYTPAGGRSLGYIVGMGSVEVVEIKGQLAALVRGYWNAGQKDWQETDILTLTWKQGEVIYKLESRSAAAEDLIRIAESLP